MGKEPEKIDKYGEVDLIAKGGMGAVYKAMHPTLNRPVILKKLTLRGKSAFSERFKREARILMDFRHDDIVTVFDHFKEGSSYFIVMEYVEGTSLEGLIKEHRYLDSVTAAYILLHCARALGYAHKRGVVHRDIKPANLLLSRDGAIKLADFGIAASTEDVDSGLTREGMTLGTPSYMAPEQFQNSRNVDARADIYALGVMAYEMLTGKQPFTGGFSPELIHAKQKGKYRNPRKYVPEISRQLVRIIRGCMKTSPKGRYQTVEQIIRRTEKLLKYYDKEAIREKLGSMVRLEENEQLLKPRKNLIRIVTRSVIAAAAVALLFTAGIKSTVFHPIFKGNTDGRLRITFSLPENAGYFHNLPVSAAVFSEENAEIPLVVKPAMFKIPEFINSENTDSTFSTLPLYLKTGIYRIKITCGPDIFWGSVYLPSGREQKRLHSGSDIYPETVKTFSIPEPAPSELSVALDIRDAVSGKDIGQDTQISMKTNRGFIPLSDITTIESGDVHLFRLTADGYIGQDYSLFLGEEISALKIEAVLLPKPALIILDTGNENIDLTVNGTSWIDLYMEDDSSGSPVTRMEAWNLHDSIPESMNLSPGRYRFEASRWGSRTRLDLSIVSGEKIELRITEVDGNIQLLRK